MLSFLCCSLRFSLYHIRYTGWVVSVVGSCPKFAPLPFRHWGKSFIIDKIEKYVMSAPHSPSFGLFCSARGFALYLCPAVKNNHLYLQYLVVTDHSFRILRTDMGGAFVWIFAFRFARFESCAYGMGLIVVAASELSIVLVLLLSTSCFLAWVFVLAEIRSFLLLVLQLVFVVRLSAAALIGLPRRLGILRLPPCISRVVVGRAGTIRL